MTLQEILKREEKTSNNGMFGLNECKKAIKWDMKYKNKSLYGLLEEYVERANNDVCFNKAMVKACWEMINEK